MIISLCADEFSVSEVQSKFKTLYPEHSISEIWTQYVIAEDRKGNKMRVDYRVDDETFEAGFGEPSPVDYSAMTDEELLDNIAASISDDEIDVSYDETLPPAVSKILRLAKPGVKAKAGAAKPYGGVLYADPGFRTDKKARYPLNNETRVRAAWAYINMPKNRKFYTAAQLAVIESRIKAAAKKFGIQISE